MRTYIAVTTLIAVLVASPAFAQRRIDRKTSSPGAAVILVAGRGGGSMHSGGMIQGGSIHAGGMARGLAPMHNGGMMRGPGPAVRGGGMMPGVGPMQRGVVPGGGWMHNPGGNWGGPHGFAFRGDPHRFSFGDRDDFRGHPFFFRDRDDFRAHPFFFRDRDDLRVHPFFFRDRDDFRVHPFFFGDRDIFFVHPFFFGDVDDFGGLFFFHFPW